MSRHKQLFSLRKRPESGYWYYKLAGWKNYKSTGQTSKARAMEYVQSILSQQKHSNPTMTLGEYIEPFFDWDRCPHIRRLLDERKNITKRHAYNQRRWLEKYILTDQLAQKSITEIRRADIIDFRSRLLIKKPDKLNTVNKIMAVLKTIFKEAIIRQEIEFDPTYGIGNIKENRKEPGIFTLEELAAMFPIDSFYPWKDRIDYTCFLTVASTGMRRGEALALPWKNVFLDKGFILIDQAWKGQDEINKPKWDHIRTTPFLLFKRLVIEKLKELQELSVRIKPDDWVFCYDDGQRLGETWWRKRFNKAMDRFGIDRKGRNITPHSFRHTLNTLLRNAGKDPAKIRATLGWRQERTQDNYTHFTIEHLEELEL